MQWLKVYWVEQSELNPPFMTGWLINKFFQGREQIKAKMAALFESGILYKLEKAEYQEYKGRNPVRRVFDVKISTMSLNMEDIQGILAILFVGYFFSIISFSNSIEHIVTNI